MTEPTGRRAVNSDHVAGAMVRLVAAFIESGRPYAARLDRDEFAALLSSLRDYWKADDSAARGAALDMLHTIREQYHADTVDVEASILPAFDNPPHTHYVAKWELPAFTTVVYALREFAVGMPAGPLNTYRRATAGRLLHAIADQYGVVITLSV